MEWDVRIPGPVVPWARPRANRGTGAFYTHPKVRAYQNQLRMIFRAIGVKRLDEGAVSIVIVSNHKLPKKPKPAQVIGAPYTHKPDIDNIEKVVLDALNGIAFRDDSQVTSIGVAKKYSAEDSLYVKIYHRHLAW